MKACIVLICLFVLTSAKVNPVFGGLHHLPINSRSPVPSSPQNAAAPSTQISHLDIISTINLITEANELANIGLMVIPCDTWIIPLFRSSTNPSQGHNIGHDILPSSYETLAAAQALKPIVLRTINGLEAQDSNFSYDRPFREEDLLQANVLDFMQKASNFHCALISSEDSQSGILSTSGLIALKLLRPDKDYFFYIGSSMEVIREAVFKASRELRSIRFKYGVEIGGSSSSQVTLYNSCERPTEELPIFSRKCFPHISNRAYSVVSTSIKPFLHYDTTIDPQTGSELEQPAGVMFSMFGEAGSRYNFTFDIEYSAYLGASGFNVNGTWYGAVGQVFSREKDIAFGVVPSVHRFPVVEPIFVTWMIRYFYIRSPPYVTTWKSAFLPLNVDIWILTLVLTVCLVLPVYYATAALYFKNRDESDDGFRNHPHVPEYMLGDLIDALNRILMEQSATVRHWTGTRIRLLILLWTAFCLILGTAYRAKLINFLTFLEQEELPRTHMELSLTTDYKLYFRYMGGTCYRFMIESDAAMHKRIMKRAVLVNTSAETMFNALFEKKGAWLDYKINAEFAMQENATLNPAIKLSPIFTRSKDTDYIGNFGWIFHKGSPLTESFSFVLGSIFNAGLYNEWININSYKIRVKSARWLKSQAVSPVRDKIEHVMAQLVKGPKALDNDSFFGVYMICLFGVGLAMLSWLVENGEFYFKRFLAEWRLQHEMKANRLKRKCHW